MRKLLVALVAVALLSGTAFAQTYNYNSTYNWDKDVAMTATVGGLALGLIQLGQQAGQQQYAPQQNCYQGPVSYYTPPPPRCVWLPIWVQGQIIGYQQVCQ